MDLDDCDFDAPRFVDFLQLAEGDDGSDTDNWFDGRTEDDDHFLTKKKGKLGKSEGNTPKRTRSAAFHHKPVRVRANDDSRPTSGASPPKTAKLSPEPASVAAVDPNTPSRNTRLQARLSSEGTPAAKKPQGKHQTVSSVGKVQRKAAGTASALPRRQLPARAVPPKLKSSASTPGLKSSEELELEKIAAMRAEVGRARKAAQESYKKAIKTQAPIPLRSAQPATMPQGFHFSTDSRLKKNNAAVATSSDQKVKDFTSTLRDSKAPVKPLPNHCTRPQPFKLSQSKSSTQTRKFESDAEKVANFSKKTPQRFRSMPKLFEGRARSASKGKLPSSSSSNDSHGNLSSSSHTRQSPRLTVAKSPALASRGRSRPVHALTREEQEQIEFEKHQREQFKAHPVNQKVLMRPNLGVPKVDPRPLTIPSEFALCRRRSMSTGDLREALNSVEEEDHNRFKAKPVDPKIFKGPLGIKPVEARPVTVAESPAFALKHRMRLPKEPVQQEEPHRVMRSHRAPHVGIPFMPKVEHKYTVPEPFQVDERSKEMLTRREQKIQQVLEEEKKAHEFQASYLPSLSPDQLPPKQAKPATKPEPFELYVDKRGKGYQEQFRSKQLEETRRMQKEAALFKAGPNAVIRKKAFQPQHSTKPLTEIDDFQLNTDMRAASREQFDQHIKQREAEIEAIKRQRAELQEREEKAAVAQLRKEAIHQATGIKKYKTPVIAKSDMPLTQAQSPKFSERLRTRRDSL